MLRLAERFRILPSIASTARVPRWLAAWAVWLSAAFSLASAGSPSLLAAEPLHERIDRLVEASHVAPAAPLASDAEFMRRVYLDLVGSIPAAADVRAFCGDTSPTKRPALVDRLLASPEHARHMATVFDVTLMERRPDKHVPAAEWRKYLFESFLANKPLDQLAREILGADGVDPKLRPAAKFYLDREGEPSTVVRDVGRMFFGKDLQCCQCHDHPLIDDFHQADYYGLLAFFNGAFLFTDEKEKKVYFAEKVEGSVTFQSVFDKQKRQHQSGPRLPDGEPIALPAFAKGDEYAVKPADKVRPVPKFSRRAELAKQATSGASRLFNRTMANRLWAHLMGHGLVDPVDLDHGANPPSHPALLDLITDELVAMKFDARAMLREVALSRTYQRSIDMPGSPTAQADAAAKQLAALEAEQARATAAAEATRAMADQFEAQRDAAQKLVDQDGVTLAKAQAAEAAAKLTSDTAAAAVAVAQSDLAAKQDVARALAEASAKSQEAAKKLPADKELAAAVEKIKMRADQSAAGIPAANKTLVDRQAAAKPLADTLAAAQRAVAVAADALKTHTAPLDTARRQLAALAAKRRSDEAAAAQIAERIADAKALAKLAQLTLAADGSRVAAEKAGAALAVARQAVDAAAPEMAKMAAAVAETQKAADVATAQVAEAQKQLADRQAVVAAVSDAAAKTELARQKLPGDAEVTQSAQKLKARAEQLAAVLKPVEASVAQQQAAAKAAADRLTAVRQTAGAATSQQTARQQAVLSSEAAAKAAAEKAATDLAAIDVAQRDLSQRFTRRLAVAGLKPLSPEQLTWSMMQAAGLVDAQRAAGQADWLKKNLPPPGAAAADPAQTAARQRAQSAAVEQLVYERLSGNVGSFVPLFAAGAGQPQQDFFATADQALFFANGGQIRGWIAPSGGNLADRLIKLTDGKALAEELYMSTLTRQPSDAETADVIAYLAARPKDRPVAIQELVWALLTSAEFRFNH